MAFVSTMILRSMRLIGEKTRGATLTSDEAVECLAELNTFMESLQTERLACYAVVENTLTLTASTNSYTIGTNGAFAVSRPTKIVEPCFVRDSSGYDTPVTLIDSATYGAITAKSVGYTVPTYLYYDGNYSATSTATIYLYPSPSANLELHINSWKQLQNFSTVSATVMLPPGYQLMIESNFAIHLAAGQVPVSKELAKIASESKAAVKTVNLPDVVMTLETAISARRRTNILTGP